MCVTSLHVAVYSLPHCTTSHLHSSPTAPPHTYTLSPLHHLTPTLFPHCTTSHLHSSPTAPLHTYTLSPLHHLTLIYTANCYRSGDAGQSYQGNVAVTRGGVPCQAWSSNLVHRHHIKASIFPELVNAENYCRNPGRLGISPWCYTLNSSIVWDYCLIPVCHGE